MKKSFVYLSIFTIIMYFLPLFIHIYTQPKPHVSFLLPYIDPYHGGTDYFVMLNSILKDFDLELKNNYYNVSINNGLDAGIKNKGRKFPRNTNIFDLQGHRIILPQGRLDPAYCKDAFESGKLQLTDGRIIDLSQIKEYPACSAAMPFLVSLFLWPFRNTNFLEPAAIFFTTIISLIGLYFLYKLILFFAKDKKSALFITLCFAFASPLWHYAGTFLKDSYIITLLLAATYFFLIKKMNFMAGLLLFLCFLIRHPLIIFGFFFGLYLLWLRKFKDLLFFYFPFLFTIIALPFIQRSYFFGFTFLEFIWLNRIYFLCLNLILICVLIFRRHLGRAIKYNLRFMLYFSIFFILLFSIKIEVLRKFFFSSKYGLITFSPFLIFSILGFYGFFKKYTKEAILISLSFFSLYAFYIYFFRDSPLAWTEAWANRYSLMIVPFLSLPLSHWYSNNGNKGLQLGFFILLIISLIINLEGAFASHLIRKFDLFQMWYMSWEVIKRLLV